MIMLFENVGNSNVVKILIAFKKIIIKKNSNTLLESKRLTFVWFRIHLKFEHLLEI